MSSFRSRGFRVNEKQASRDAMYIFAMSRAVQRLYEVVGWVGPKHHEVTFYVLILLLISIKYLLCSCLTVYSGFLSITHTFAPHVFKENIVLMMLVLPINSISFRIITNSYIDSINGQSIMPACHMLILQLCQISLSSSSHPLYAKASPVTITVTICHINHR